MSFVSTNNKSGMGGLTTTTPPITGESGGVIADSVAGSVAEAAEAAVEQAAGSLFGALPEPSGLVKAAVAAAQAAVAAGMAQDAVSVKLGLKELSDRMSEQYGREVNFMIFDSIPTATSRAPSIILP